MKKIINEQMSGQEAAKIVKEFEKILYKYRVEEEVAMDLCRGLFHYVKKGSNQNQWDAMINHVTQKNPGISTIPMYSEIIDGLLKIKG